MRMCQHIWFTLFRVQLRLKFWFFPTGDVKLAQQMRKCDAIPPISCHKFSLFRYEQLLTLQMLLHVTSQQLQPIKRNHGNCSRQIVHGSYRGRSRTMKLGSISFVEKGFKSSKYSSVYGHHAKISVCTLILVCIFPYVLLYLSVHIHLYNRWKFSHDSHLNGLLKVTG